ncbi:MAG: potassium transporter TrkA, partial [Spirochaetaceae bacterium]|nr:potassium transporter TrkA [Spirochaetaceae bacterium]
DVAVPIKDTVVDTIIGHLRGKSVTGVHTISDGDLEIIEYVLPKSSSLLEKSLKEVANPGTFLIMLIKKQASEEFLIPGGDSILNEGDHLVIICTVEKSSQVLEYFGGTGE